jgi:hypothetical protein
MIAPKIPLVQDGQILSTNLVNSMIGRIEYAADLLRQYKLIAGDEMYVEPHFDGTRVSYFYPTKGGATPIGAGITIPPNRNFPFQGNLFDLVGRNGTGGKVFDSADQERLFGDPDNPYIIDLADIARLYGSNARIQATGVIGEFLPTAFGYIEGLFFAWWVFSPSGPTGSEHFSNLPGPPSQAEQDAYGIGTQMQISVGVPFATLSFKVITF